MAEVRKFRKGVLLVVLRGNEVLIVRKVGRKEWQLPAEGCEAGEYVTQTAYRGLQEELGLQPGDVDVNVTSRVHEFEFPEEWKKIRKVFGQRQAVVLVRLVSQAMPKPDKRELDEVRFVSMTEAMTLLAHESLKQVVEEAMY